MFKNQTSVKVIKQAQYNFGLKRVYEGNTSLNTSKLMKHGQTIKKIKAWQACEV